MISALPMSRRADRGRRWRRYSMPLWPRRWRGRWRCSISAASRMSPDRRRWRAGRLRHGPGQRAAGRLGRAAHRRAVRPGRRPGAGRPGRMRRCWRSLLAHPYFAPPAPKSLDRLEFARALAASGLDALSPADGAATLVAFTAGAVAAAAAAVSAAPLARLRRRPPQPGDHAGAARRPARAVEPVEAVGWNGDALEAQCLACSRPGSRPGCRSPSPAPPAWPPLWAEAASPPLKRVPSHATRACRA